MLADLLNFEKAINFLVLFILGILKKWKFGSNEKVFLLDKLHFIFAFFNV